MNDLLRNISEKLQAGRAKDVKVLVEEALASGIDAHTVLSDGLMAGMNEIGEKFKQNLVYVPEVLIAARAMSIGVELLKDKLADGEDKCVGRVCIGTVKGDRHDIGKRLCVIMLEGKGLEVIDLGVDVSPEKFVTTAIEKECDVICCSALLTTTMGVMKDVVKLCCERGIRDKVKIMVGGAPVTADFCAQIGADAYTDDAASAADVAYRFCASVHDGAKTTA